MGFKAGIDLDGVIFDILDASINYLEGVHNIIIKKKDWTSYYISDLIPIITEEKATEMYLNPGMYVGGKELDNAIDNINKLKKDGWWIDIVTARDWSCLTVTLDWLSDVKLEVDRLSFVTSAEKSKYAEEETFNIFIEDKYDTAKSLEDIVPLVYLIDAPYNQASESNAIIRVKDFNDILEDLKKREMYAEPK
jgi:uncharacterized HAD superfamily protein